MSWTVAADHDRAAAPRHLSAEDPCDERTHEQRDEGGNRHRDRPFSGNEVE